MSAAPARIAAVLCASVVISMLFLLLVIAAIGGGPARSTTTQQSEDAIPVAVGEWTFPVAHSSYTTVGGFRTAERPRHAGIDIMSKRGTQIHAASTGTVIKVTCNASNGNCDIDGSPQVKGCGWYVDIAHAGNIVTRYCHMSTRPTVNEGDTVQQGQIIGNVGSSGNSSGPHLHFEVHTGQPANNGNAVNPIPFFKQIGIDACEQKFC